MADADINLLVPVLFGFFVYAHQRLSINASKRGFERRKTLSERAGYNALGTLKASTVDDMFSRYL